MFACTDRPEAGLLQVFECAGDIGNARNGEVHDGTGGCLVGPDVDLGGALVGNDDARRADHLGRPDNGAKVAGIRHMVEHHDQRGPLAGAGDDIVEPGVGKGPHLEHDALMRTMARELVELDSRDVLNRNVARLNIADQRYEGCVPQVSFSDKRPLDGKARAQSLGCRATTLDDIPHHARTTCGASHSPTDLSLLLPSRTHGGGFRRSSGRRPCFAALTVFI